MRKAILLLLILALLPLVSCESEPSAYELLYEFVDAYRIDGVVYSKAVREGDKGYAYDGFLEKLFVYHGRLPENFAVLPNLRSDYGAECGVFVCDGLDEVERVSEMCLERMRILDKSGEYSLLIRTKNTVFYSTLRDKERARNIWREIIG